MGEDLRNIKHQCAVYAYKCIYKCIVKLPEKIKRDYRSEVRSAGTKITVSGLLQTLTFYLSKSNDKEHFKYLLWHLILWVLDGTEINREVVSATEPGEVDYNNYNKLIQYYDFLLNTNGKQMMYYTARALKVCEWLSRFAEAPLPQG